VSDDGAPTSRRVRRGEGEVTQWPRGLVDYVAKGPEDAEPSVEEDRTANRLRLAGRLLSILASEGREVPAEIERLRTAEAAFAEGDRARAARLVDALFADLDAIRASRVPR